MIAGVGLRTRRYLRERFAQGTCRSAMLALYKEWLLSRIEKPVPAAPVPVKVHTGKTFDMPEYYERKIKEFMRENRVTNSQVAAGTGLSFRTVQRVKQGESSFKALKLVLAHLQKRGMVMERTGRTM